MSASVRMLGLASCAGIALACLAATSTLALSGSFAIRPVGLRISADDPARALLLGAAATALLFVLAGRRWPWRILALAVAVLLVGTAALGLSRQSSPMYPIGDEATTELAVRHASDGRQLLGAYSRYGWHHPGPTVFYLIAPWYVLGGERSPALSAGALVVNFAALLVAAWILARHGGPALVVAFLAGLWWVIWRADGLLVSHWNAHLSVLLLVAAMVTSAAVAAGSPRLIPLLAALTSLAVQAHVAVLPPAAAIVVLALVPAMARAALQPGPPRASFLVAMNWAAWVSVALWLLPVAQEVTSGAGNLTRLWQFALQASPGLAVGDAWHVWARAIINGVGLTLPLSIGARLSFEPALWPSVYALALMGLLVLASGWGLLSRHPFHGWLALTTATVCLAGLWSTTQIPEAVHDHEVFWISIAGALGTATLLGVGLLLLAERWPLRAAGERAVTLAAASTLLAIVAVEGLAQMRTIHARSQRVTGEDVTVRDATAELAATLDRLGLHRPLLAIDQPVWGRAAGVALQLRKRDFAFAIDPGLVTMFAGSHAPDGSEDVEVTFSGEPLHREMAARPGNVRAFVNPRLAVDVRPIDRSRR